MTTVGYGDVFAVSPFGRCISIVNALWGAFVISLLVSSIGRVFDLSDHQKKAIADITNSKSAAASLKASFKYFLAKNENNKVKNNPELANEDYVYTKAEISTFKDKMVKESDRMRIERL